MEQEKTKLEQCGVAVDPYYDDLNADQRRAARERRIAGARLLWTRRDFALRVVGAGLALSIAVAFIIPKRYSTSARLMPPDSQSASNIMMLSGMEQKVGSNLGELAGDLLGFKSSGALFVGMLQSQTIQDRLVQQFDLKRTYKSNLMADARKKLSKNTIVEEDRKSGIITITVTDRNPERAAAVANAYISELNTMVAQLSTSSAHRERIFLEGRLQSVRGDLGSAEAQLAQFSSQNNTLDIQQQGKAMLDAAANLAGQTIAAESELEGLRQIYTENNAHVRELSARVAELRKQLDKLGGVDNHLARTRQNSTESSDEPTSDSSGDMPYPSIRKLPLLGAKYADYYREAKIQETVYELLTEQNELAKVEEAKETPSVKVLDPAEVPEKRAYPPRLIIICSGTLIAIALSILATLGNQRWRDIEPDDQGKILVQEIVASIQGQLVWLPSTEAMFAPARRVSDWFRSKPSKASEPQT
jgi:uncharacterized protein involved in exopolysaccharide biosynthesis